MQIRTNWFPLLLVIVIAFVIADGMQKPRYPTSRVGGKDSADCWTGPGEYQIPVTEEGKLIRYGRDLVVRTAYYLGPHGRIAPISNGMNCQNCHLDAGTKPWGNNYGAVAATYPKFRARSGTRESIEKRVNDCIERSLNGKPLDSTSREMRAFVAYIQWVGSDVKKGSRPKGTGIMDLPPLSRPADTGKGHLVYMNTCERCHGKDGQGQSNQVEYIYPPLWGKNSYNTGAGLYRISRLAGYAKNNMPHPLNYHNPTLTDEQAWDVAAFINSQPRPVKDLSKDWPNIAAKPFDHPFGPYADTFSEARHKYGPWN